MYEIRREREGEIIEKTAIRAAVLMMTEVCINSRKLYEQEFEIVLLAETADYFRLESNQFITETSCS